MVTLYQSDLSLNFSDSLCALHVVLVPHITLPVCLWLVVCVVVWVCGCVWVWVGECGWGGCIDVWVGVWG